MYKAAPFLQTGRALALAAVCSLAVNASAQDAAAASAKSAQAIAIVPALAPDKAATLPAETQQLIDKGRMVAIAADCAACHTAPNGGKPFAGNYRIGSPLGEIVSTNITPSKEHGIGNYSEQEFARAVREGVRKDGAHLYPAMPYDAYARMSDEDLHALYTYFQQAVPVVEQSSSPTQLPFPFNMRFSMAVWNALYLQKGPYVVDTSKTPEWNRGAYLTEVLAHCTTCHTPRNALMGSDKSRALGGAYLGPWYAPNISSDPVSGIGGWSEQELVQYMATGHAKGKGQAAGGMAEAVQNSLQFLPESDLKAIAVYLKASAPIKAEGNTGNGQAIEMQGKAADPEPQIRGLEPGNSQKPIGINSADSSIPAGQMLYSAYCASCHQATGAGTPDQAYPSLFHNTATGLPQHANLIATMLYGVERNAGGKEVLMPAFGEQSYVDPLSNEQIAAIANYVLAQHGNPGEVVTASYVQQIRQGNAGPVPLLAKLQPMMLPGLIVLVIVVLAAAIWLMRRKRGA